MSLSDYIAPHLLILFVTCLLISSIGFYRLVYFISVGYGYSIAGMAIITFILYQSMDAVLLIQFIALTVYGIRLGTYLVYRDFKKSYTKELVEIKKLNTATSFIRKIGIWILVSLLYVLMFIPAYSRTIFISRGNTDNLAIVGIIGVTLMILGLTLEGLADYQKSQFKSSNPSRFCDIGLYKIVRCPNYFGELTFWTGNFITGLVVFGHLIIALAALVGYVCIFLIMMGSTKRLEFKQDERYGSDETYVKYRNSVPVLFPLTKLYTLKNIKVYLE